MQYRRVDVRKDGQNSPRICWFHLAPRASAVALTGHKALVWWYLLVVKDRGRLLTSALKRIKALY